jgi:hypothetical protein
MPWKSFHPLLDQAYAEERKSNAGCRKINSLSLFKVLVLQYLFNLGREAL